MTLIDQIPPQTPVSSECWLPVVCDPNYEVSDWGNVQSVARWIEYSNGRRRWHEGRLLTQTPNRHRGGKLFVHLSGGKVRYVHQLVLEAHVGPRPDGMNALHRDDDSTNNRVSNLYWGTQSQNGHDAVRNGRHHNARKTHCRRGHEFTPENTIQRKDGRRECRECRRIYDSQHTTTASRQRKGVLR